MSELSQQIATVKRVRRMLEPLPSMVMQAADVRRELSDYKGELAAVTAEPITPIRDAEALLETIGKWPDGTYLGHGRHAITRVIDHLDLWLTEHPEDESIASTDRIPTESEQIRYGGDVSRRIRGGQQEVMLKQSAGVGGTGETWVDID